MICEMCKKNNATVHIREIINGDERAAHYCDKCAVKKEFNLHSFEGHGVAKCVLNISSLCSDPPQREEKSRQLVCPVCNLTSDEFHKTGRLGCPSCYEVFDRLLLEVLPEMHAGCVHKGKKPGCLSGKITMGDCSDQDYCPSETNNSVDALVLLQHKLKRAIALEDFELADVLKDQLFHLQENKKASTGIDGSDDLQKSD